MISADDRQGVSDELVAATTSRVAIAPISQRFPAADLADAYAIQARTIDRRLHDGATLTGWKVGLTSQAMQQQLGVDQPDFGPLLDDMAIPSGGSMTTDALIAPRVEAEFAFELAGPP